MSGGRGSPRAYIHVHVDTFVIIGIFICLFIYLFVLFFLSRTASVFNSSEPFWGEEYRLHVPLEYQYVSVYVYDHDSLG